MKQNQFFFLIVMLSISTYCFSQEPPEKKKFDIDFSGIKNNDENPETKKPKDLDSASFEGLKFPEKNHNLSNKAISGFQIDSNLDLENFGKLVDEPQFGKQKTTARYIAKDLEETPYNNPEGKGKVFKRNQFLGDITTKSPYVYIKCRDHANEDNDQVRLLVNDNVLVDRIILTNNYSIYKLKLEEGFNKIDFFALNYGLYSPNTAQLKIIDNTDTVLSNNQWSLYTGFKATVVVIKE